MQKKIEWKTIKSKIVHQNNWFKVIHDKFKFPNGRIGDYYLLKTGGSVTVVPVQDDNIIFIKEYRYPIKKNFIRITDR